MSKRQADWHIYVPSPKVPRLSAPAFNPRAPPRKHQEHVPENALRKHAWKSYTPAIKHHNHPNSGVGTYFHYVPYPLSLLPFQSWWSLHSKPDPTQPYRFLCPKCFNVRTPTPHARKLFLVGERLSWPSGGIATAEKYLNEERNWKVNYELGIANSTIEHPDQKPGGNKSRKKEWHPFESEFEMIAAFKLVEMATHLTESSWKAWVAMSDALHKTEDQDERTDLPYDGHVVPSASPSNPASQHSQLTSVPPKQQIMTPSTRKAFGAALRPLTPMEDSERLARLMDKRAEQDPEFDFLIKAVSAHRATRHQTKLFSLQVNSLKMSEEFNIPISSELVLQDHPSGSAKTAPMRFTQSHDFEPETENRPPPPTPPSSAPSLAFNQKKLNIQSSTSTTPLTQTPLRVPTTAQKKSPISVRTLQDFYSLLDKIERTSYVGAQFLEAYAEYLRDDLCKDCWFQHNVLGDAPPPIQQSSIAHPPTQYAPPQYALKHFAHGQYSTVQEAPRQCLIDQYLPFHNGSVQRAPPEHATVQQPRYR